MIIRIAIPVYLMSGLFFTYISSLALVGRVNMVDRSVERSLEKYERIRAVNLPARERTGVWRVLNRKARALSKRDRKHVADIVTRYSAVNGHDPLLLLAVMEIESGFRRDAVSKQGAVGLMQVRPFVARGLAKELNMEPDLAARLVDIDINVRIGSYYLAKMIKRFGDLSMALEAYNLGPTNLSRKLRSGESIGWKYTRKVLRTKRLIKALVQKTA